jgi:hypothetical protein
MTTTKPSRQVLLELFDADPIAGRLTDRRGHATEFVGWLGLAGAIETLTRPEACLNAYVRAQLPASPGGRST